MAPHITTAEVVTAGRQSYAPAGALVSELEGWSSEARARAFVLEKRENEYYGDGPRL